MEASFTLFYFPSPVRQEATGSTRGAPYGHHLHVQCPWGRMAHILAQPHGPAYRGPDGIAGDVADPKGPDILFFRGATGFARGAPRNDIIRSKFVGKRWEISLNGQELFESLVAPRRLFYNSGPGVGGMGSPLP